MFGCILANAPERDPEFDAQNLTTTGRMFSVIVVVRLFTGDVDFTTVHTTEFMTEETSTTNVMSVQMSILNVCSHINQIKNINDVYPKLYTVVLAIIMIL